MYLKTNLFLAVAATFCVIFLQGFRFFQDWLAEVTHGAKNGGSFLGNDGPKYIKLTTVDVWVVNFTYTLTQTLVCIYVY